MDVVLSTYLHCSVLSPWLFNSGTHWSILYFFPCVYQFSSRGSVRGWRWFLNSHPGMQIPRASALDPDSREHTCPFFKTGWVVHQSETRLEKEHCYVTFIAFNFLHATRLCRLSLVGGDLSIPYKLFPSVWNLKLN